MLVKQPSFIQFQTTYILSTQQLICVLNKLTAVLKPEVVTPCDFICGRERLPVMRILLKTLICCMNSASGSFVQPWAPSGTLPLPVFSGTEHCFRDNISKPI